jgi:1-acyl-sn-glycerol-3-phosphate acyltransferase
MLYRISQLLGRLILRLYFRVCVEGQEHIPKAGACIIVANHTSFLDPFLIGTITPRIIHFLTYAYFYYLPQCHWYCKRTHCIPLKQDGKDISALKTALRLLKDGACVGIFPEGRRSDTGQLLQGESGVALIALKAKVPILPIGIRGAYESFPVRARFPKPHRITVTFGKPFRLEECLDLNKRDNNALQQQATDVIMSKIAELCS